MMPQQGMTPRLNRGATRLIRSSLRVIVAVLVLVGVCLAWLALFLLFLPFLLLAEVVQLSKGNRTNSASDTRAAVLENSRSSISEDSVALIFDRRNDVSKLYGCNTRNVRYRWTIFEKRLDRLRREFEAPIALDFGAGSLRDSFELALLGFKVTSFDLDQVVLNRYFASYNWNQAVLAPTLVSGSLCDLSNHHAADSVQLIIAFDVIEHLIAPEDYVRVFREILSRQGFLFTIVPNRRSLFERYFKHCFAQATRRGQQAEPGVPHVQFRSPLEWEEFFQENGFQILEHDMTIGHFVNDWWNGLLSIPLRVFVYPVLQVVAFYGKFDVDPGKLESTLCPSWLMERVNVLDQVLKNWLGRCFGWNLIVAQKR